VHKKCEQLLKANRWNNKEIDLPRRSRRSSPANGIAARDIGVIGFHGQTVLHDPDRRLTILLGRGDALASRLGIPVVHDFRAADADRSKDVAEGFQNRHTGRG
jgi:hypothetical protein